RSAPGGVRHMSNRTISWPVPRSQDELQRAHDILAGVVLHWSRVEHWFPTGMGAVLVRSLEVLCWALGHNHNTSFAERLGSIERTMTAHGCELELAPEFLGEEPN